MTFLYTVLMIGVAVSFLAVMLDAVVSVSRKPSWVSEIKTLTVEEFANSVLAAEHQIERRTTPLSFIGQDRRAQAVIQMRKFG